VTADLKPTAQMAIVSIWSGRRRCCWERTMARGARTEQQNRVDTRRCHVVHTDSHPSEKAIESLVQ